MKSNDRLGDLHRTEEEVLAILKGLQSALGDEMMPMVIMTIGMLYDFPPQEFMERLGHSVIHSVKSNPDIKDDPEANLVMSMLEQELKNVSGKKKDSNIGYL